MLEVLSVLEGGIHDDAVILSPVFQKIAELNRVAFGGEHVGQRIVSLDGVQLDAWASFLKSVQDVTLGSRCFAPIRMPASSRFWKRLPTGPPSSRTFTTSRKSGARASNRSATSGPTWLCFISVCGCI